MDFEMHVGGKAVNPCELSWTKWVGRAGAPGHGRSQHPCILKDEGYKAADMGSSPQRTMVS